MKSLMPLLSSMLHDCSIKCGTTTTRDLMQISRRIENEGLSFLTITLGDFASDFERSLEQGHIDASLFRSFGKVGAIPKLFSGMLRQVFDSTGVLLSEPSITSIRCIRQVCRMWKKILLPCSGDRIFAAFEKYTQLDEALAKDYQNSDQDLIRDFGIVSDCLWSAVLAPVQYSLLNGDLVCRHGKGAVAEKILPNQKYTWKHWHTRLSPFFEVSDYGYSSILGFLENCDCIELLSPELEPPVRVVQVPKTQKSPRIIAVDPACMQYTQQALLRSFYDALERNPLTRGFINFTSQEVNASLAKESSKHGLLATLDLSDASDRVHKDLVWRMLASVPQLRDACFACRSTSAIVPTRNGGEPVRVILNKFASMGSALCFPIESMVFWTLLLTLAMRRNAKHQCTQRDILRYRSGLYVYGDDIVAPVYMVPSILDAFKSVGLKVNSSKSFWIGKFRESCGMDAYDGQDITPIYVRRPRPKDRSDVSSIISWVELANQLVKAEFYCSAQSVRSAVDSIQRFPDIPDMTACVGYKGFPFGRPLVTKWCKNLQRPLVKGLVVVPRRKPDRIDGWAALTKWFLSSSIDNDRYRYESSVSFGSLALKSRWCVVN